MPAPRLDAIWAEVDRQVDLSSRPLAERLLTRAGVREDTARLLAVTPSLRGAWLTSILLAALLAALAANVTDGTGRGMAIFLTLAPLLPVAGVALSYGPAADPAYELTLAAPYSVLRLVLLRSVAVVTCTVAAHCARARWRSPTTAGRPSPGCCRRSRSRPRPWRCRSAPPRPGRRPLSALPGSASSWSAGAARRTRWSSARPGRWRRCSLLAGAVLALLRFRHGFSYDTRRSS